jgi:hypothetical protein
LKDRFPHTSCATREWRKMIEAKKVVRERLIGKRKLRASEVK